MFSFTFFPSEKSGFNSSRTLKKGNNVTMSTATGHCTKSLRLCCKSPPTALLPLGTNPSTILSFSDSEYSKEHPPQDQVKYKHPYQTGGPGNVMSVDVVEGDVLVRVIMPGVGEDGYKVWLEKDTIFFEGVGEMELEADQNNSRTYRGGIVIHGMSQEIVEVTTKMKNGILMITIPAGLKIC